MIQILLLIGSALIGGILILFKKNKELESDKKLNDIKVEDAKLETKQEILQEEKQRLVSELKQADKPKKDLSDSQIEDFWKEYKK